VEYGPAPIREGILRTQCPCLLRVSCLFSIPSLLFAAQAEPDSSKLDDRGNPIVFQVSILDALSLGFYQGVYALGALKRRAILRLERSKELMAR
jgi:hypothetical protein